MEPSPPELAGQPDADGTGAGWLLSTEGMSSGTIVSAGVDFQVPGSGRTGTPSCAATMNSCQACAGSAPPLTCHRRAVIIAEPHAV